MEHLEPGLADVRVDLRCAVAAELRTRPETTESDGYVAREVVCTCCYDLAETTETKDGDVKGETKLSQKGHQVSKKAFLFIDKRQDLCLLSSDLENTIIWPHMAGTRGRVENKQRKNCQYTVGRPAQMVGKCTFRKRQEKKIEQRIVRLVRQLWLTHFGLLPGHQPFRKT